MLILGNPESRTIEGYFNEANTFLNDPCKFIEDSFPPVVYTLFPHSLGPQAATGRSSYAWPSHLVFYDGLLARECISVNRSVESILEQKGYVEKARFFNTPLGTDSHHAGDVVLFAYSYEL